MIVLSRLFVLHLHCGSASVGSNVSAHFSAKREVGCNFSCSMRCCSLGQMKCTVIVNEHPYDLIILEFGS